MKYLLFILLIQARDLPVINSTIERSSDFYEKSIDGYKKNEFWGDFSYPLSGKVTASATKPANNKRTYNIKNIQDYNLNTAWVFESKMERKTAAFEFIFKFPKHAAYAGAYQFDGICYIFNGYCKTLNTWTENSRAKKLLVYYNEQPVCYIHLKDTWHFQSFDISKFFKNRRDGKYLDSKYEIKNGDSLKFEVVEVYRGTKYNDVAISEFLCDGGTN